MHPRYKFGDRQSTGSPDTVHKYFCDRLKTDESRSGLPTFYVQSGFASWSLHARLQVSVYSSYDLCHPTCPKIWFVHFDPSDLEK